MIVEQKIKIKGRDFIERYSDKEVYIERDDELYEVACDPYELRDERLYFETDIPIEHPETKPEEDIDTNIEETDEEEAEESESEEE